MSSLQDKKEALFNVVAPYFNKAGYMFCDKTPNKFYKDTDNIRYELSFNFLTRSNNHSNTLMLIHFKDVEQIILSIGIPNNDLTAHKKGSAHMITIKHPHHYDVYESKFNKLDLSTTEGFQEWGKLIITYMEGEGKKFIEHYSYLPNVLLEMNRLEEQGKPAYRDILLGGIDHIFRGLIISKLCNDSNYEQKLQKWESKILVPKYEKWHPYYEKLKEILEGTKPKYNLAIS